MEHEKTKTPRPNRMARALGIFFAVMLAFTLIGRAMDSLTLPVVKLARVGSGPLRHVVEMTGVLTAKEELPVIVKNGLTVSRVLVRPGQRVEAGEKLIEFDMTSLSAKLGEKQALLTKRKLEAEIEEASAAAPKTDDKKEGDKTGTDAQAKKTAALKAQVAKLEIDALQGEADALSSILRGGAALTASKPGTVTEVLVKPGDLTAEGAALRFSPAGIGLIATAGFEAEQAKRLSPGAAAKFMLPESSDFSDGATVLSVAYGAAGYEARVELPEGSGAMGQTVRIRVEQDTKSFGMRVPVGSLTTQNGLDGVFRVKTGQSVLGEQEFAEFVPVEVIDKDMENAAIEGNLSDSDRLIASASKPVRDGDRIRSTQ